MADLLVKPSPMKATSFDCAGIEPAVNAAPAGVGALRVETSTAAVHPARNSELESSNQRGAPPCSDISHFFIGCDRMGRAGAIAP